MSCTKSFRFRYAIVFRLAVSGSRPYLWSLMRQALEQSRKPILNVPLRWWDFLRVIMLFKNGLGRCKLSPELFSTWLLLFSLGALWGFTQWRCAIFSLLQGSFGWLMPYPGIEILFFPNTIRKLSPLGSVSIHVVSFTIIDLFGSRVCKTRIYFLDHLTHDVRIVNNHTGTKMVGVVRLAGTDILK